MKRFAINFATCLLGAAAGSAVVLAVIWLMDLLMRAAGPAAVALAMLAVVCAALAAVLTLFED